MSEDDRSAAETRGLLRFAQGLGLDEAIVREMARPARNTRRAQR
ncbi:hypothetical protein LPLAFNJD_LOCUS738 [Methylorubrum aminovorans]